MGKMDYSKPSSFRRRRELSYDKKASIAFITSFVCFSLAIAIPVGVVVGMLCLAGGYSLAALIYYGIRYIEDEL